MTNHAKFTIKNTNDGFNTLTNSLIDECYHSVHGAQAESEHVFIEMGLRKIAPSKPPIRVFEMGFGTGLNALLSLKWAEENQKLIEYTSIELVPIPIDTASQLNYTSQGKLQGFKREFELLHISEWGETNQISPHFNIHKIQANLESIQLSPTHDLIFYDAFSPDKQPELWTVSIFQKLYGMICNGGALVTYCAKGYVRRNMIEAGFKVVRLAGPPGKREMLRAEKSE